MLTVSLRGTPPRLDYVYKYTCSLSPVSTTSDVSPGHDDDGDDEDALS